MAEKVIIVSQSKNVGVFVVDPQFTQTKLDVQLEALAIIFREASRFPNGGARIGVATSREIAYRAYEYMRQEGMVKEPGYGYANKSKSKDGRRR